MRMRFVAAAALLAAACGSAGAQDGGKIAWKGKGEDVKAVMAQAKKDGKAMMMFFTSEG